jgi:acetolactate synthase-1/2/3 large subunit
MTAAVEAVEREVSSGDGTRRGTVVDAVAEILRREGVEFLSAYPTTPLIDAAARVGIKPVLCRQERVGVGIADGFTRVAAGKFGVFACQFGPGAENAFSGIASAYADGVPILVISMGNAVGRRQTAPLFQSSVAFAGITKSYETVMRPQDISEVMRRAINAVRSDPPGPAMVEIPIDVATAEAPDWSFDHVPVRASRSMADPAVVAVAASALEAAARPVILAGQGVLRSGATPELVELAELLDLPVVTTVSGKSGFPEDHPLSLGVASVVATAAAVDFLSSADLVLAVGTSLTRHFLSPRLARGSAVIQIGVAASDMNKSRNTTHPLIGDAKLVLGQLLAATRGLDPASRPRRPGQAVRIEKLKRAWLQEWEPKLNATSTPITPYRVIAALMEVLPADDAIVTHDSGSPRDQLVPFYRAGEPNSYVGWGKSHALGAGLGLAIGAKLAAPEKVVVHVHGDAAVGQTGFDLETAVRCEIPILSLVLNNSTMAIETPTLVDSHALFQTRDIGGDYVALAEALGVAARRVDHPSDLAEALRWAIGVNKGGAPALVEVITSCETEFSHRMSVSH